MWLMSHVAHAAHVAHAPKQANRGGGGGGGSGGGFFARVTCEQHHMRVRVCVCKTPHARPCVQNHMFVQRHAHVRHRARVCAATSCANATSYACVSGNIIRVLMLVAVAGGFFASGFKRAFKMKDFGDTIPGHGGITDRFDCQVRACVRACV